MSLTNDQMLHQIDKASSFASLWALVMRYYRGQGFEAFAYVLLDRNNPLEALALLEYGFPPEVLGTFEAMGSGRNDAMLRVAMANGAPVLRSTLRAKYKISRDEAHYRQVIDSLGVGELLSLPLYGPHRRDALGSLARPSREDSFDPANFMTLHMIAQAAHLKAISMRPPPAANDHGLSVREIEILRRVAQGKSNGATAAALDISAGTVDTYLRRIFEKLDVADRTSAAVKGVSLGLIRL